MSYQTKEEYIQEEYESYLSSISPILSSVKGEYGSKATLGYVLLNGDKQPQQRNTHLIPVTNQGVIEKLNGSQVLPSDVKMIGNRYYLVGRKVYWGKKTKKSILELMGQKEIGCLNAVGTGEFFVVVDIDKKNLHGTNLIMEDIESVLPPTFVVETPSGGKHYFYLLKKGSKAPRNMTFPCIDLLSAGKLVVAPSQYREGKGSYRPDTSNPRFKDELTYWDDSIALTLTSLFNLPKASEPPHTEDTHIGYLCTSSESQEKVRNVGKAREPRKVVDGSTDFIKGSVRLAMQKDSKVKIEEGMRNSAVFYYCSYIGNHTPASRLLSKALEFNRNQLVKPLPEREVESIVKSCLKRFSCYNGKSPEVARAEKSKFKELHQELNELLIKAPKSEEFTVKIEDIAPVIQGFFEAKFKKAYTSSIPTSEVGKTLRAAGYKKKQLQKDGVRAWLWNVDIDGLVAILDQVTAAATVKKEESINEQSRTSEGNEARVKTERKGVVAPRRGTAEGNGSETPGVGRNWNDSRGGSRGSEARGNRGTTPRGSVRDGKDEEWDAGSCGHPGGWWSDRVSTNQLADHLPNAA